MQTSLHILSLVDELQHELLGGTIVNTEFYKKERTACFFVRKGNTLSALTFVYHPSGPGFFVVPASKLKIDTREKPWPIFDLHGGEVAGIDQLGLDRIFYLEVTRKDATFRVVYEAIGPNGNIWLLDDQWGKQAVLRNREFTKGEKYEPSAPPPDKLNPFEITVDVLGQRLTHSHSPSLTTWLERNILGFNRTLAKEICSRSDLTGSEFHSLDDAVIERLSTVIHQTAEKFREPAAGYLYTIVGAAEVYPFKLSFIDEPPEKFKTLS
ncbi:MAG TPA: NFACT family protein, partial [Candidatus Acidoferrum sp.]|nr:NFACT family protein [Candidatus Acidoferrum sp.]